MNGHALIRLTTAISTFSTDLVSAEPGQETHIELTLLLLHAADRVLHRLVEGTPT